MAEHPANVWMGMCACRGLQIFVSVFVCKAVGNLLLSFRDLIDGSSRRTFEEGASFLSNIRVNNSMCFIGLKVSMVGRRRINNRLKVCESIR